MGPAVEHASGGLLVDAPRADRRQRIDVWPFDKALAFPEQAFLAVAMSVRVAAADHWGDSVEIAVRTRFGYRRRPRAPLLEQEGHVCRRALVADRSHPVRVHGASVRPALAAGDNPVEGNPIFSHSLRRAVFAQRALFVAENGPVTGATALSTSSGKSPPRVTVASRKASITGRPGTACSGKKEVG